MSLTGVVRCRIPHLPIDGAWAPARGWAPQQRDEYVCKKDEFGSVFGCFALQSGSRAQDVRREGRRTQSLSSASLHPAISPNGLSLYVTSGRPGGLGGSDIWVSQRASLDDPWGPPQNLGQNINSKGNDIAPDISPDGHWLFFSSNRPPASAGTAQIWVSFRQDTNDDFGWEPAVNLGPDINLAGVDANAPTFFQDHKTDVTSIYFNSIFRTDGPGDFDIYV